MLYLTDSEVRQLLPVRACVDLMRTAFLDLDSGQAINHPRRRLIMPTRSVLHYMVASDGRYFGAKIYSVNLKHGARFLFLLYRSEDAALLALMEANYLGQIRTGAVSGLATSVMARPESSVVGIIGTGFQARSQLEAIAATMPVKQARAWSRSEEKRKRFVEECGTVLAFPVEAAASAEEAVRGADIIVTATSAGEPVIESGWVSPGAHVNAMGSNHAKRREIPGDLVARSGLIAVDSLEQSHMEAGDLLLAFNKDEDWKRVVELHDVIAGRAGRTGAGEITLFKSNGLAVEDVAAAAFVYEKALETGAGREFYS